MNKEERKILYLFKELLNIKSVENPCDIKGLVDFHNLVDENISQIRNYIDEITCYDIPKCRINEIINELTSKNEDKKIGE